MIMLGIRNSGEWRTVQQAPEVVRSVLTEFRAKVAQTLASEGTGEPAKRLHVEDLRRQAASTLGNLGERVERAVAAVRERVNEALRPPPKTDAQALLHETKKTKAWARCAALFNAAEPASVLDAVKLEIARAVQQGEQATLDAMREELPVWLTSKGLSDALPSMQRLLDAAAAAFYTEVQREALAARKEFEAGAYRVSLAIAHGQEALNGELYREVPLPGFLPSEMLTVEAAPIITPEPPPLPRWAADVYSDGRSVAEAAGLQ